MKNFLMIFVFTAFLLGSAFIGGVYAQDIVYSEDFDSGMGAWSGQWGIATSQYHSPPNSMADSPSGNYGPDANVSVAMTSDIDLTSYPGATVDFWTKYDIETGFDYVYMYVSSNGGQTWNDFYTFNGEGVAWHNFEADLGGYAGESVRFKFTLVTDGAYEVDGMYIDDFTVTGLTGDNSPPLIIHEGPTVFTSVPDEFTVIATITDFSGVNSAWVTYTVDNGSDEIANTDSVVGDVYYFTIPAVEAGAHVNYTITAEDNANNSGTTAEENYVSGTVIYYDDGEPEFIYEYLPNDKCAVRFTPSSPCIVVTGLISLYTDTNRPIDTVDVEVWDNGSGNYPGQSMTDPIATWPASTLDNPHAVTYVDFRGLNLTFDSDFHVGYTYRTQWPVILGDSPMVTNRSNYYSVGTWMPATTDFSLRVIVDYNIVGVDDGNAQTPIKFGLQQNYPNPFNAKTTMNYSIPKAGDVKLDVFNLLGQRVTTLVNEHQDQGEYSINWDANDLPSGVYFAKLTIENSSKSVKLMLLK